MIAANLETCLLQSDPIIFLLERYFSMREAYLFPEDKFHSQMQ